MRRATSRARIARGSSRGSVVAVLVGGLIAFHMLLPLDRGFPTFPLFGRPLNWAIAATATVFFGLVLESRGAVLAFLREPYSLIQAAYCCVFVVSSLRSEGVLASLHATILYYAAFVLNYAILRQVTRAYGVRWLSPLVVKIGLAAAAIGIAQGVLGLQWSAYDAWFERYYGTPAENFAIARARASGTMNNPIVFSVLMVLLIPYALDLKHRYSAAAICAVVLFAAALSGSRTALAAVVFAMGAVAVYRARLLSALPFLAAGMILLMLSIGALMWRGGSARVDYLMERGGLRSDSRPTDDAGRGVSLRRDALAEGIREMYQEWDGSTWIIGRGYFTSAAVGQRVRPWYNTVDNVFMSVLYERGLAGLLLFVGAFGIFLFRSRRASVLTLHWYTPIMMAAVGFSFSWDGYSTFNILVIGSMAVAMGYEEQARRSAAPVARPTSPEHGSRVR